MPVAQKKDGYVWGAEQAPTQAQARALIESWAQNELLNQGIEYVYSPNGAQYQVSVVARLTRVG